MGMRALVVAIVLAGACACWPPPPRTPSAGCEQACQRLGELGCEEALPLPDGTSCASFCDQTERAGHALDVECVMRVESCEEIDSCGGP